MILTGSIKLADDTILNFYENGEVLRTVKKQHSKCTMPEAIMYIQNTPSYTHASKSYAIDGALVTFATFKKALDNLELPETKVDDKAYNEQYTQHTPLEYRDGFDAPVQEEMEIDTSVDVQSDDDDDQVSVVVDPDQTGDWFA